MIKAYYEEITHGVGYYELERGGINRNSIQVGFEPEFISKESIDGTIYRKLKGYRMNASWSYPMLHKGEREEIMFLLREQAASGKGILMEMDIPYTPPRSTSEYISDYKFKGYVYLTISSNGKFGYSQPLNDYIWSGFTLSVTSRELIKDTSLM